MRGVTDALNIEWIGLLHRFYHAIPTSQNNCRLNGSLKILNENILQIHCSTMDVVNMSADRSEVSYCEVQLSDGEGKQETGGWRSCANCSLCYVSCFL
jgi:hypothetical protein